MVTASFLLFLFLGTMAYFLPSDAACHVRSCSQVPWWSWADDSDCLTAGTESMMQQACQLDVVVAVVVDDVYANVGVVAVTALINTTTPSHCCNRSKTHNISTP